MNVCVCVRVCIFVVGICSGHVYCTMFTMYVLETSHICSFK